MRAKYRETLLAAIILNALAYSQALDVQLPLELDCNPNEPEIIIQGSRDETMTTIVITNPDGSTVGEVDLTSGVLWKPKIAYVGWTEFVVVDSDRKRYKLKFLRFSRTDTGNYIVDIKYGGADNTIVNIFIGNYKGWELEPVLYHNDVVVEDQSSFSLTPSPEVVVHTGKAARADVFLQVNHRNHSCIDTVRCTVDIGQGLESGEHTVDVSYHIRYREQCANVTGHLSLYVTVPDTWETLDLPVWAIAVMVIGFIVLISVISIPLACHYAKCKRTNLTRTRTPSVAKDEPKPNVLATSRSYNDYVPTTGDITDYQSKHAAIGHKTTGQGVPTTIGYTKGEENVVDESERDLQSRGQDLNASNTSETRELLGDGAAVPSTTPV